MAKFAEMRELGGCESNPMASRPDTLSARERERGSCLLLRNVFWGGESERGRFVVETLISYSVSIGQEVRDR
jgi:hypothetical protein